jgi:protein CMS1
MSNSKKRQAEDEVATTAPKSKKKKSKFQEDDSLDMELGINSAIARMDNQLMADHLAQKTIRFGTELSTIELADLTISGSYIKDSSSFKEDRTLPNLPQFLEKFTEKPEILAKTPKANGAPHTIVVTSGGLRAANIVRALRKYQTKDCTVAKLVS